MYRYPSEFTQCGPQIQAYADRMSNLEGTNLERAIQVMHQLYEHFQYKSGVTDIHTTAEEAMRLGQGVCQDYAHILMTLCRMQKIPARYVAGFLDGEGATHAWIEIYDNGYWYGFDPTHDRTITDNYIKVAHGRDACDCPMERGVFRGLTTQNNRVKVVVTENVPRDDRERH